MGFKGGQIYICTSIESLADIKKIPHFTVNSLATGYQCIYRYFLRAPVELLQELLVEWCMAGRLHGYGAVLYTPTLPNVTYLALVCTA